MALSVGTEQPAATAVRGYAAERTSLVLLALANFAVGFGAFVVVGILPPMADGFAVSEATAGQAMTVYALGYGIGSPLGVALTGRFARRHVLAGGLVLFGIGAALAALAPTFAWVLAARVAMASGGGLVTPVAAAVGLGLVRDVERGRALALVFGGLTLAQAVGVPGGAWAGYAFGWRTAFALAAVLSAVTALLVVLRLPARLAAPATSLRELASVARRGDLMLAVAFTALFLGGLYVVYTFLAALLENRYALGRDGVTAALLVYGLGAVVGNGLGGRLTDGIGPRRTLALLCAVQLLLLPLLTLVPMGVVAFTALITAWSAASWSFMVPQQARLAALAPPLAPVLFALNASAIYLGASMGAAAGGALLASQGGAALGVGGAVGVALAWASLRLAPREAR